MHEIADQCGLGTNPGPTVIGQKDTLISVVIDQETSVFVGYRKKGPTLWGNWGVTRQQGSVG